MDDVKARIAALRDQADVIDRWLSTLGAPAQDRDGERTRTARRALAATRARLEELHDIQGLAGDISGRFNAIDAHLGPDEIGLDEPLDFGTYEGCDAIRTANTVYVLQGDAVVRLRPTDEGVERVVFRDGHELGRTVIPRDPESA